MSALRAAARLGRSWRRIAASGLIALCTAPLAQAGQVEISAYDNSGKPLPDVAIALYPASGIPNYLPPTPDAVVAQHGMQFEPFLTVIRTGTRVTFPNRDNMEHHLKSFSETKSFEFQIYSAGTPPPVTFDKAGPVALYCLLHEWMRGFIYVVDTPYYAATDGSGTVSLSNLPDGKYEVRAWHPIMSSYLPPLFTSVTVNASATIPVRFDFPFKPKKPKPHPVG
jgi:hypothetical protein